LLKDLAKGKVSAAILVSDITRPCPSYKFLSYLIDELKAGGIDLITIVLGLGIHRSHAFKEKVKLVGNYALENAAIIDSDPERCKLVSCQYKYIGY
jgi:nickel-dependent lactate racemase